MGDNPLLVANQPYDESVSVCDDEEVATLYSPSPRIQKGYGKQSSLQSQGSRSTKMSENESEEEFDHEDAVSAPPPQQQQIKHQPPTKQPVAPQRLAGTGQQPQKPGATGAGRPPAGGHMIDASDDDDEDDDDEDETESSEDDEDAVPGNPEGAYDPAEYEHLPVSQEIKDLFQYISRYTPQQIDLENKLRPFIPEYIPAVGDIDAFLKLSRPDLKQEQLGLRMLDEPRAKQSDPTVLDLQLRSISKQTTAKQVVVRSIEDPDKNPKAIDTWISSIGELHRNKPAQHVHYSKTMPDIEALMQEWPPEFEDMLKNANLPSPDLVPDLKEYIDIVCAIVDIPVNKNRIESLHCLFTLFSEFKNSQHFNQLARDNLLSNDLKPKDVESMAFE